MKIKMKNIAAIIALLFVSISATAQVDRSMQPKPGPAPTIALDVPGEFELKNGLKVLVVENHKLPRVSYSLNIDNMPSVEADKAGVSGILSAMLGNGTTSISKDAFNEEVDFLGARMGFGSSSASASCLSKYSERILELMADAAVNPLFSEEEFQKEKDKAIEGLKSQAKNVGAVASRVGGALSYGKKHPYGEFITDESLNNITLNDVRAYYQKNFNPNNAYLVVVGDVDIATVKKQVKKYFKNWEDGLVIATTMPQVYKNVGQTEIDFVDMPNAVQSNITVTNNVDLKMNHPDYFAVKMANYILGGGGEGYLFLNLREDKAYTYGSYSNIGTDNYGAARFTATAEVRNMVTDSSIVEILKEVNRIKSEPVTAEALKNAKAKYTGNFVMALESPATIARYALNIKLNDLPEDFYTTYLKKVNAVTVADISRVANTYFNSDNARVVVVGKGSEVLPNLEKTGIPIKYFDKYANSIEKPIFSKPIPAGVTAQTVIDKYLKTIGGKDKAMAVNSVFMTASIKGLTPFPLKAEIKSMLPNKESMEISAEGMGTLMKQKWNGATGYAESQGQKIELSEKEIEDKKNNNPIFPELFLKADTITLESIVTIEGEDNYKITVVKNDKNSYKYYGVDSGLLNKTESTSEVAGKEMTTTIVLSDYKAVNGIMFPHKMDITSGPQKTPMEVQSIKINEEVTQVDFN